MSSMYTKNALPLQTEIATETVKACPVEQAIHVIAGKWKMLVLRSLLLNNPQRYNELSLTISRISSKKLTRNLRELVGAGFVMRGESAAVPKLAVLIDSSEQGLVIRLRVC